MFELNVSNARTARPLFTQIAPPWAIFPAVPAPPGVPIVPLVPAAPGDPASPIPSVPSEPSWPFIPVTPTLPELPAMPAAPEANPEENPMSVTVSWPPDTTKRRVWPWPLNVTE